MKALSILIYNCTAEANELGQSDIRGLWYSPWLWGSHTQIRYKAELNVRGQHQVRSSWA